VVIDSPARDLYEGEAQLLLDYADAGGKIVLLTNYGQAEMPNLQRVTDAFGVYLQPGVVLEGDTNYYYQYPIYMLPNLESHSVTGKLAADNLLVMYYMGQGIEWLPGKPSELTVQALLTSSDLAYTKADVANTQTLEKEEGDVEGPFDLAVLVRNENTQGHLVWYTTGALLNNGIDQMVSGNNSALFLNTLNFLCERESNISIAGKNLTSEVLMINAAAGGWWRTLYMVVLPLGCIAAGACIFIRRRSLR
jgi:ABC-2 type transport system permease protein